MKAAASFPKLHAPLTSKIGKLLKRIRVEPKRCREGLSDHCIDSRYTLTDSTRQLNADLVSELSISFLFF